MLTNFVGLMNVYPFHIKSEFPINQLPAYFEEKTIHNSKLYKHIQDVLFKKEDTNLLRIFRFEFDKIKMFNEYLKNDSCILSKNYLYAMFQSFSKDGVGKNVTQFKFKNIYLVLGQNNIGFLLFEFELFEYSKRLTLQEVVPMTLPGEINSEDVKNASYFLRKIAFAPKKLYFVKKEREGNRHYEFRFEQLVDKLLSVIPNHAFFENSDEYSHVLSYSAVYLQNGGNDRADCADHAKQLAISLSHAYKNSYKIAPHRLDVSYENLVHTFENSYFSVAQEGLAQVYFEMDDEETNQFFKNNMSGEYDNSYLTVYLLTLYQHYSLLKFSIEASELYKEIYTMNPSEAIEKVDKFHDQIVYFRLASSLKQISNVTHQNELYKVLRICFGIDILLDDMEAKIKGIHQVIDNKHERAQHQLEKKQASITEKKQREINTGLAFLSIIYFPLTLITGLYGMNVTILNDITLLWDIVIVITIIVVNASIYWFIAKGYLSRRLKKTKN